jgi:hypothetical protein
MMKATKTWVLIVLLLIPAINVYAWPWPDTGQTKCYNDTVEIPCPSLGQPFYGQDAQYQGPTRSYIKLGQNGVVLPDTATYTDGWVMTKDNVTGLIWEMKTDDNSIHDKDNTYTWCDRNPATNNGYQGTCGTGTGNAATDTEAFIKALNDTNYGGFSDWRIPTVKELSSLINSSYHWPEPTIDTAWFPNTTVSTPRWPYWSSTPTAGYDFGADHRDYAWYVRFDYGHLLGIETAPDKINRGKKSQPYHVRAVRAGQPEVSDHWVDNGDGTVTDINTGLMWQRDTAPGAYKWQGALAYAEALLLAGYDDWRLPNRNELQSFVDYSKVYPSVDPLLVPYTVWAAYWYYWTSTPFNLFTPEKTSERAWVVGFDDGDVDTDDKNAPVTDYYVRAVRGGQSRVFGHLIISAPNQADRWNIGEQKPITWDTAGIAGNVKISLSRQGGKAGTFRTIIESTENDGTYNWKVTGPATVNAVLKIEPLNDPSKGTSQGLFSISGSMTGLPWLMLLLEN